MTDHAMGQNEAARPPARLHYAYAATDPDGGVMPPPTKLIAQGDTRLIWVNEGDLGMLAFYQVELVDLAPPDPVDLERMALKLIEAGWLVAPPVPGAKP